MAFTDRICRGSSRIALVTSISLVGVLVPSVVLPSGARPQASDPPALDFNRDVRPILSNHCFPCHGPDEAAREAELRLDLPEFAFAKREGGAAIVPGRPEESKLVSKVTSQSKVRRMPPARFNKPLDQGQVELLRRWVAEGAPYDDHWSYRAPVRRAVPELAGFESFLRGAIDSWVLFELQKRGMTPSEAADPVTLVRRLSYDLRGLPPTPQEVQSYLDDARPGAYSRLVDQFLSSPHYGEHMAVFWLDLVRYADSVGYHADNERTVFPYRDYVIDAFNDNKPFDEFTVEQLAGDLLKDASAEQRIAAAYQRLIRYTPEDGAQPLEYEKKYAADRVRTTASTWMAATMACCECHTHKFDPYSHEDFYRFAAFFADIEEQAVYDHPDRPYWPPFMDVPVHDAEQHIAQYRHELERTKKILQNPRNKSVERLEHTIRVLEDQIELLRSGKVRMPATVARETPRETRLLPRGDWMDDSGPVVEPGTPSFLPPLQADGDQASRLDLARWLISPEHPLTARVFVNRIWKQLFGRGLSRVLDDFGSQGEFPLHAALLDMLAIDFVESGWDVKGLIRQIVMSGTYRQSANASPELLEQDPDNRFLARQTRFRLHAEGVRDTVLAVSGLLERRIGGPSVKPYQPRGYWKNLNFPKRQYIPSHGGNQYRRGLYSWWQRTFLHPSMLAFDAPTREECTAERPISNSPLQALTLLNDPSYVEAARAFAVGMLKSGASSTEETIDWAMRQAVQRAPTPDEVETLTRLFGEQRAYYSENPKQAEALLDIGLWSNPEGLDPVNHAAWTAVARVLLNLHELITRP